MRTGIAGTIVAALLCGCGPSEPDEPFEPTSPVLPRLTATQYRNTLVDLFGADVPPTVVEADTNPYLFFSIGAATTSLSELGAQQYADAALKVATWAMDDVARRDALIGCVPASAGDSCTSDFIRAIGLRLFRRPLTAGELDRWVGLTTETAEGDAHRGIQFALYGLLQSPNFLYRVELGEADPDNPDRQRYTRWEMAGRLSFLLWNTSPDVELLAAAEAGDLLTSSGIEEHAERMLSSPRARAAVQDFFGQYFDLGELEGVERDALTYPAFNDTLPSSMETEIRLLVDDYVFRRDADLRELFFTRRTFVNSDLAALYEVDAPGATKIAFVPVELPSDGPRAGILTFGAFLAMNAHPTETSPTRRGKYVRERVLCEEIDPPPDGIDFNLDNDPGEAKTLRERLEQHANNPFCASCHKAMDPPGFLFENFDSIGAFRTHEAGFPVDTSGDLDGIPLENASDLAAVLATDERVAACVVKQLYRHASARLDNDGDAGALRELTHNFDRSGYRFRQLLVDLAVSDSFRSLAEVTR